MADPDAADAPDATARAAMHGARTEATIVLSIDVALLAGLGASTRRRAGRSSPSRGGHGWWLAAPALILIVLLVCAPLAELSPGRAARRRPSSCSDSLAASDAAAVALLLVALAGSDAGEPERRRPARPRHGGLARPTSGVPAPLTFGLLFWLLDGGGPRLQAERGRGDPDFQFPQDALPRTGWSPRLGDYLYVSLTNAVAVSPTDTMPLTRRAKGLMGAESLISFAVVVLVVARAVNVLGSARRTARTERGPARAPAPGGAAAARTATLPP